MCVYIYIICIPILWWSQNMSEGQATNKPGFSQQTFKIIHDRHNIFL